MQFYPYCFIIENEIGRKLQVLDDLKKKSEGIEDFSECAAGAIVEMQTHLFSNGFIILRDEVMKEIKFDDKY